MALGWQLLVQSRKKLYCRKCRPYKVEDFFQQFVNRRREVAHPVPTKVYPMLSLGHGHAVCTLQVPPPTSSSPTLSIHTEPIPKGHIAGRESFRYYI